MTTETYTGLFTQFTEHLGKRGFTLDVCGQEDIDALFVAWHTGNKSVPKRGLLVSGKIGCGKTHFLRTLLPDARFIDCATPRGFEVLESGDMVGDYMGQDVILDNFGMEPMKNDFGNKRSLTGN